MISYYVYTKSEYVLFGNEFPNSLNMGGYIGYITTPPSSDPGPNKAYAWKDKAWITIDDYSSNTYYDRSKANQQMKLAPGELPDPSWTTTLIPLTSQEQIDFNLKTLDEIKKEKCNQIDTKTDALIENGYTFDNNIFSLSIPAQINWTGLKSFVDAGQVQFPLALSTKDDKEYYLQESNAVQFFGGIFTYIKSLIDSGRALKLQVTNATTADQVDKVTDLRF